MRDVLNLTTDQVQKITTLYTDYNTFRSAKNMRMIELNRDLSNQFLQPVLDPGQIGASYVEAEAIRRDLVNRQNSYRAQVVETLTRAQQVQYQSLLNSVAIQPLLCDAACAFLEDNIQTASFLLGYAFLRIPTPTIISKRLVNGLAITIRALASFA